MKKLVILSTIYFILPYAAIAQQNDDQKVIIHKIWIDRYDIERTHKGVLYEVQDSSILVSNSLFAEDYTYDNTSIFVEVPVSNIETIRLRRKNNIGRGALISGLSGIGIGAISGWMSGDDPPCDGCFIDFSMTAQAKARARAILFPFPFAIVGALAGSLKTKFKINGDMTNYQKYLSTLREKSVRVSENKPQTP